MFELGDKAIIYVINHFISAMKTLISRTEI